MKRAILVVSAWAAAIVIGCDKNPVAPTTGSISLGVVRDEPVSAATSTPGVPALPAAAGRLDAARVRVSGPTNKSLDLTVTPSGFSGTVDGLLPGAYTVVVEGLVAGEVDYFGQTSGVQVRAGENTGATITFNSFRAVLDDLGPPTAGMVFTARWSRVANAQSYKVESDKSPAFLSPSSTAVTDTFASITVTDTGTYNVRVRAVNTWEPAGRASDSKSISVVGDRATQVVVTPGGATLIAVGATKTFAAEARNPAGVLSGKTFSWASLNTSVATTSATTGVVTAVASGQASVCASVDAMTACAVVTVAIPGATAVGSWSPSTSGTVNWLRGLWGRSATDLYGVGAGGTIRHFNGTSWTAVASGTTQDLFAVWGTSTTDIYAVGANGTILHYNGTTWSPMTSGTSRSLYRVWGASPTDVYAVGLNGEIRRFNGSNWTPMTSGVGSTLWGIWGTSASDVYAVGILGVILRFDGTNWSPLPSGMTGTLYNIWGTSPIDLYAVGDGGTILHSNGTNWTAMGSGTTQSLVGIWGTSSNDAYAVGTGGATLRFDGTSWSALASGTTQTLYDIWGTPTDTVYAAGDGGTILRGSRRPVVASVVVTPAGATIATAGGTRTFTAEARDANGSIISAKSFAWQSLNPNVATIESSAGIATAVASGQVTVSATVDNVTGYGLLTVAIPGATPVGSWSVMTSGTTQVLNGVWGTSPSDVYAVGNSGTILHFNGTSWSPMASGTAEDPVRIWGTSASDIHAVGRNGTILHFNGTSWSVTSSGTNQNLFDVWGTSPRDVYAVGNGGTVLHFNGTSWSPMTTGTTQGLFSVWGTSPSDVYVVGEGGAILHFDGASWSSTASGSVQNLFGVWGASPNDIYAVGLGGTILRYNGTSWTPMTSGTTEFLLDVWGTSATDVYAVGNALLRFDGAAWRSMTSGATSTIEGVWGTLTSHVYGVGGGGAILRGLRGPPPVASVVVTPAGATITTAGGTRTFTAEAQDANGNVIPGKTFGWGTLNLEVATINNSGTATAVGSGQVTITAYVDGVVGNALLTVAVPPANPVTSWNALTSGTTELLLDVWGASASAVYAVGYAGTILRFNGTSWSAMNSGITQRLYAVWSNSPAQPEIVYAVGDGGTILSYGLNGPNWRPMTSPTLQDLRGIWGASPGDIYAIGLAGTILHSNDAVTWNTVASGTTDHLSGVWGTSRSNVYVVGTGGTILRFDGAGWSPMASGTTQTLRGVWGTSTNDVYTVGAGGTILHYNGADWSLMASGTTVDLIHIGGTSANDVYAVGVGGTILRFDGTSWSDMTSGTTQILYGVGGTPPSDVYAVGSAGTTLKGMRGAPPPAFRLTVSLSGTGRVGSTPAGISCETGNVGTCATDFPSGTSVTLNPVTDDDWEVGSWAGDCAGGGQFPTVVMTANRSCAVAFNPLLRVGVTEGGTVTSSPGGISCPPTCVKDFTLETSLTLTAAPASGWGFAGWGGDCTGAGSCALALSGPRAVTATFARNLESDVPLGGLSGTSGSESFFRIAVPGGTAALNVILSGGTGDVDLYIRSGTPPTLSAYDCAVLGSGTFAGCEEPNPAAGDWYIMLRGGLSGYSGVTLVATSNSLTNGGFSSGSTGWVVAGNAVVTTTSTEYRTAPGYAVLGTDASLAPVNSANGTIYQQFTVPSGATSASLSFWLNITSDETSTTTAFDFFTTTIRSATGTVLAVVAQFSNVDKAAGAGNPYYTKYTFDLSPYIGQTIQVHFQCTSDSSLPSVFRIDDVVVKTS